MISTSNNKKGFLSIFWLAVLMLVTTAILVTATYSFSSYAITPTPLLADKFTAYYYAEFGIMCGKAMLDGGFRITQAQGNIPVANININGRNVQINMQCTSDADLDFTITSIDNTSPSSFAQLSANWRDNPNRIEQIN